MYGVNNQRRVPCTNSPHHGFRPANEVCKYCAPEEDVQPEFANDNERWLYELYCSQGWSLKAIDRVVVRFPATARVYIGEYPRGLFTYVEFDAFECKYAEKLRP